MKNKVIAALVGENVEVLTITEYLKMQEEGIGGFVGMVEMIIALSVLLATVGLLNNQMVSFLQRKKELAVLYSIAMSRSQLSRMLFFEAIGTFLLGCLIGGGVGALLTPVFETALFAIGVVFEISIDIPALLGMLSLIFIILSLSTLSPVLKLKKLNIVDEIKYE